MYFAIPRSDNGQYWCAPSATTTRSLPPPNLMKSKQSVEHAISVIWTEGDE